MKRIVCVGYRCWANKIYEDVSKRVDCLILHIRSKEQYDEDVIIDFNPELILYYGWSWKVSDEMLNRFTCLMLHPSPLPLYRGGSPIQNQILDGQIESEICIFIMTANMDDGDVVARAPLSLVGDISDIFDRMHTIGFRLTESLIQNGLNPVPQDESQATYCKRRKPEDSEITFHELKTKDAEYLYNKIRMLSDPYPNAYITTSDGSRLLIKQAEIYN